MTDSWTQLEGHLVDEKFPLRRYLGGSNHSIVFLTHHPAGSSQDAAIKLIPADSIVPDLQFSRWRLAEQLSHPHLLRQFGMGRCQLDGRDWLYIVTEYADENLAQILPQRPLTQEELRDALKPVLDTLAYLHSRNFIYTRIKPANILVAGDQIKLSTDGVLQRDDSPKRPQFPSAYDAPECASGSISAASDSWSLGMVVVEALTQNLPVGVSEQNAEPFVPTTLPVPFIDIARRSLKRDPQQRWTVTEIATCLNSQSKAAVASGSAVAPPAMIQPTRAAHPSRLEQTQSSQFPPLPERPVAKKYASSKPSYFLLIAIGAAILIVILVTPKFANRNANNSSAISVSTAPELAIPQPASHTHSSLEQSVAPQSRLKSQEKTPSVQAQQQLPPVPQNSLKVASEKENIPAAAASSTEISGAKGDVLDHVLPDVSQKARDTIRGTVRVNVRVHVSPSGNVSQAELDSENSSKYFADLSLQAARRWAFQSPEVDGHSVSSEWLIRFEFTPFDTKVFPRQANP
jgi:TonB family protein